MNTQQLRIQACAILRAIDSYESAVTYPGNTQRMAEIEQSIRDTVQAMESAIHEAKGFDAEANKSRDVLAGFCYGHVHEWKDVEMPHGGRQCVSCGEIQGIVERSGGLHNMRAKRDESGKHY